MADITIVGETLSERRIFLKDLLTTGVYQITFTKVNGETRTMPCTLQPDLLPKPIGEGIKKDVPEDERIPENMSVWVTDANGWRSFKIMNVTRVETL
jgi:hypothetical protein